MATALEKIKVTNNELTQAIINCDAVINKRYLDYIKSYDLQYDQTEIGNIISSNLGVRRISKIVYDPDENNLDKMTNVFATLNETNARLFVMLASEKGKTQVLIGTCDTVSNGQNTSITTLENSLKSNFPGIRLNRVVDTDEKPELRQMFKKLNDEEITSIACISGIPSLKTDKGDCFVQGLEKIVDGMGKRDYYAIFLAEPVSRETLETIELDYSNLYSTLSILEQETISLSQSETSGISETIGKTLSQNVGKAISHSTSHTSSTGESHSSTKSIANTTSISNTTSVSATTGIQVAPMGVGGSASTTVGNSTTIGNATTVGYASTNTKMTMEANTVTEGETNTINEGISESTQNSISSSTTTSETRQRTIKNRQVMELINVIDAQLKRIRECKNYGMWNFGIYFLGHDTQTTSMGANICAGILSGETSGVERRYISQWCRGCEIDGVFEAVLSNISRCRHPQFRFNNTLDRSQERDSYFSQTTLISTRELASGMSLPQKSIPSIPVFEVANFGRAVSSMSGKSGVAIKIGNISHLGNEEEHLPVKINVDSLTSHTFITGSTGSGKSNAVYTILQKLINQNKKFLVIEPAKGEYKYVFGGVPGVHVYGTNYMNTEILRINPFAFTRKQIHVIEHIDRLIEILNAVWPMYAAMPAMLKDAIETAYISCGWDLVTSHNKYSMPVFPDFSDLLEILPQTINASGYSAEVKSNYIGSLVTRVKSLTNGYFRNIFTKDELPEKDIFDESTIIDISRVGSAETKALIMGIIFMRLQEHRVAEASDSNASLKHVTILEEAHNLLRRSNAGNSGDTGNLQAKSVEMLANSIAEMRTYGEGFVIVDQAPGLLDQSVIRNTNTKIILRLPDWDDRLLVGKAANLNEAQIEELARLETGCAAVYQNDWQEAVLCKIEEFKSTDKKPYEHTTQEPPEDKRNSVKGRLLQAMLLARIDPTKQLNTTVCKEAFQFFPAIVSDWEKSPEKVDVYIRKLLQIDALAKDCINASKEVDTWTSTLLDRISDDMSCTDWENTACKDELLLLLFSTFAAQKPENAMYWNSQIQQVEKWRVHFN